MTMHIEHLDDVEFHPDDGEPIRMSRVAYLSAGWADSRIDRDWQPLVSGDAVPWHRLRRLAGKEGELVVIRKGREQKRLRVRLLGSGQHGDAYPNARFFRLQRQEATQSCG